MKFTEICNQLREVHGDMVMNERNLRKWCEMFYNGWINLHNEARQKLPTLITDKLMLLIILPTVWILFLVIVTFALTQKSYWAERDELQNAVTTCSWVLGGNLKPHGQMDESLNKGEECVEK